MCMICYLPAKTAVDVQNDGDIWRRQIEPGMKAKEAGIKGAFGILPLLLTTSLLMCLPPLLFGMKYNAVCNVLSFC
jgi:hypothetical protein